MCIRDRSKRRKSRTGSEDKEIIPQKNNEQEIKENEPAVEQKQEESGVIKK